MKWIKLMIFWAIVSFGFLGLALVIKYEIKPRQKLVSIAIDIKNRVNICRPDDKDIVK